MSLASWWNGMTRRARAEWLAAHRLKTSIAIYTWHCLKTREQERIENERNLEEVVLAP